jgi:hypothetical protein
MIEPTFWSRSSPIEIDESITGELVGFVTAGLGGADILTGAGVGVGSTFGSGGLARTSGGLFGLLSGDPSGKGLILDENSCFEVSADSTFFASDAGVLLSDSFTLGVDPRVSDSFLFLGSFIVLLS